MVFRNKFFRRVSFYLLICFIAVFLYSTTRHVLVFSKTLETSGFKGNRVLVIVIDGLRPDYVTPKLMPNLSELGEKGFIGQNHHSVFPTATRVNSASIATGTYPHKHGIVNNLLYLPEVSIDRVLHTGDISNLRLIDKVTNGRLLTTASLGELLKDHGKKLFASSSGSSGSAYLLNHRYGNGALIHSEIVLPDTLAPLVKELLGPFQKETRRPVVKTVKRSVDALLNIGIDKIEADAIITWITEPDGTTHDEGIGAVLTIEALKLIDNEIDRIMNGFEVRGLLKSTNIFIISDHGFSTRTGEKSISTLLLEHGLKSDESSTDVIVAKEAIYVTERKKEIIPKIVRLLQQTDWIGPIFTRGKSPSSIKGWVPGTFSLNSVMCDHERSYDILTAGNWSHDSNEFGFKGNVELPGVAGHNSTSPYDIRATFIASGPDIKNHIQSSVPTGNVDIVPTILFLLGIQIPEVIDGRVIREALKGEPSPSDIKVKSEGYVAVTKAENVKYKFTLYKSFVDGTTYVDSTVTLRQDVLKR